MTTDKPLTGTEPLSGNAPSPQRLKLRVVSGPDKGQELVLARGSYFVGKESGLALQLTDSSVSRRHLMIEVLDGGARVTDAGSTNGSFYQGQRFTVLELVPPAVLRIGRTELQLFPQETMHPDLPASERDAFGELRGRSLCMRELFAVLERAATADADVLVMGETGTGKELCAAALHAASPRAKGPFVVCDLAGVTPALFESELFGHVKGAFTGATTDREGLLEQAHGGTLFLDEVGELPLELQPRLLRALERREVKRVGGNAFRALDVRVVAATHRDLPSQVQAKTFREDLYHRLATLTVQLPPLRERREDIPFLVDGFLERMGKPPGCLSADSLERFRAYDWPGNVRELRNVVERAVGLGEATALDAFSPARPRRGSKPRRSEPPLPFKEAKLQLLEAFEHDYVAHLIEAASGNVTHAARAAGISRVHLQTLLKKHKLGTNEP